MRERIARAIFRVKSRGCDWDQSIESDAYKKHMFAMADAVLDAMREPTEGMLAARENCLPPKGVRYDVAEWRAMIDEAKRE